MFFEDYHPKMCVAGIGDLSLSVLDHMMNSHQGEGIAFMHLNDCDLQIYEAMQKSHLLFIIFDSSIDEEINLVLELADKIKEAGILTLGICCIEDPIVSDADQRWQILEQLRANMDTLAIVSSNKDPSLGFKEHETEASDYMVKECQSIVHSLSYIFSHKSFVGIDFEDVREALSGSGYGAIGAGHAQGDDRGVTACANAIEDLTNKGIDLRDVRGISVKILGHHASLTDFSDVMEYLESLVTEECRIVAAAYWEDLVDDKSLKVSLLVSGLTRETVTTVPGRFSGFERKAS